MADAAIRVAHRTPGRVRLSVPGLERNPGEARRIADAAAAVRGVSKVEARTATGSLVLFHLDDWTTVAERLRVALGAAIEEAEPPPPPGGSAFESTAGLVDALNSAARRAFGGRTDLTELVFLALLGAGTIQLARGQVVGPATTLFSQALQLMTARRASGPS
jgi:hypothetical protein